MRSTWLLVTSPPVRYTRGERSWFNEGGSGRQTSAKPAASSSATSALMASMSKLRTLSITEFSPAAGRAPGWAKMRMPSRNATNVGIAVMLALLARYCSASVWTLPKTMSGLASPAASKTGANWLHGPDPEAQKSTRTMPPSAMVFSKVSWVSSVALMSLQRTGSGSHSRGCPGRWQAVHMSRVSNGIAGYWNDYADAYDAEPDHGLGHPATREAWRVLLERWLPARSSDVADLACGTGSLTVLLAELGHTAVGVDLADKMVARARAK